MTASGAIRGADGGLVLWTAASPDDVQQIAAGGWRSWPGRVPFHGTMSREEAVAVARDAIVAVHGAGHVLRLEVDQVFAERHADLRVPAERVADLTQALAGGITEEAEYQGPIGDIEVAKAEAALRTPLPTQWRRYLQGPSWFRRGWIASGAYVWLYSAEESVDYLRAWGESARDHPGILIIGGDGAGEMLTTDLREPEPRVLLTNIVSPGWKESIVQSTSISAFIEQIEDGSFEFAFDG